MRMWIDRMWIEFGAERVRLMRVYARMRRRDGREFGGFDSCDMRCIVRARVRARVGWRCAQAGRCFVMALARLDTLLIRARAIRGGTTGVMCACVRGD